MPDPASADESAAGGDERRRFELLQSGLDLINQGLTVFDHELRLVAWNQRFFTLLDFPAEMARVGTPFADFMRFNAVRGEYGAGDLEAKVAERVAAARSFQPHYMERARPNGTIVAVRGEPLPHRGFVTLYTDITAQRDYERLIRGRNDDLDRRVRERTAELLAANERLIAANAAREKAEAALVQAQKMEAVGRLTGGLAHDFNNLLTIAIGNLIGLRDRFGARAEINEFLGPALAAAQRGVDLTRRLLAFARQQPLEPRCVEVNRVIANVFALLRRSLPENVAMARESGEPELFAQVDPHQLENALVNLALNARDAMPRGGRLTVRAARRELSPADAGECEIKPGPHVEVAVADTGAGMDAATLTRAFEPFFTSKEFGSGSGLGLSMVYGFARQSGGAVRIHSAPGAGTTVVLLLPAGAGGDAAEPPAAAPPAPLAAAQRLVLLVEDEPEVRKVIRRQLADLGHLVIEAASGDEAVAIIQNVAELSALVSDVVMPGGMDGRRLAELAIGRRPDLRVVLVSGYAEGLAGLPAGARPYAVLRKPCSTEELAAAIEGLPQ